MINDFFKAFWKCVFFLKKETEACYNEFVELNNEEGFTLVEAVVVVSITAVLMTMSLVYTRSSEKRVSLFTEQAKVVGVLERAKALAIQKYRGSDENVCAFGVVFDKTANKMIIFKDLNCDNEVNAGEVLEEQALDGRIEILIAPPHNIVFTAPYLETNVGPGNEGKIVLQIRDSKIQSEVNVGGGGDVSAR